MMAIEFRQLFQGVLLISDGKKGTRTEGGIGVKREGFLKDARNNTARVNANEE